MFTDNDLKRLKDDLEVETPIVLGQAELDEFKALLSRLEAAEKALKDADGAIYSVYDPYKNDCPLCGNFMSPCNEYCDFPKFHKSLETWRKAAGK